MADGTGKNVAAHYRLQTWWAASLLRTLDRTVGIDLEVNGLDALGGRTILLSRHASLADALVTAVLIGDRAGLHPRMVLKSELAADPCLGVVGHRVPNVFVDREASDSSAGLAQLQRLAATMDDRSVCAIFPEGTRSNPAKRARALGKLRELNPDRAQRLERLAVLLPIRPAGTLALLAGAPGADVVVAMHSGLEGLDTFGGIHRHLRTRRIALHYEFTRFHRSELPPTDGLHDPELTEWLDQRWVEFDQQLSKQLLAGTEPQ